MLIFTTWLWGGAYGDHYVRRLKAAVDRNVAEPHTFIALTDSPRNLPSIKQETIRDIGLTTVKGCFVRLRLFDPAFQKAIGIQPGDRVVNLDLDLVITGPLDPLFDRPDDFCILQGINTTNPCPYNGSVWMFRAGARPDVWRDFSLDNYRDLRVPYHAFPDDQGWFHYKMPDAVAWGPAQGVYGFKKQGWPSGNQLPEGARIVAFPGWRDPQKFEHLDWIRSNWK